MELSAGLKPTVYKPAGGRVKSFGGRTKGTKGGWLVRRERSGMGRWGWPSHGGTGLVPPQRTETLDTRESLSFVQFNKNTQCETFPCFWGFIGGHPVPPSPCPCCSGRQQILFGFRIPTNLISLCSDSFRRDPGLPCPLSVMQVKH